MNRDEYEKANEDDKRNYHGRKFNSYRTQLKSLQKNEVVNEDSPMYKEMIRLQELFRFHLRQYNRIRTKNKMETFYSLELETNRKKCKGQMTPQGNPMPYQEISQELYETLSKENKIKYHSSLKENKDLDTIFHARMKGRLQSHNVYETFASPKYGGESFMGRFESKEEYENMSKIEKEKYHSKMQYRSIRDGDKEGSNFHSRMLGRLKRNSICRQSKKVLPNYYSLKEEKNSMEMII